MTKEDLEEILAKAKEVCHWVDWMRDGDLRAVRAVEELKRLIESKTGQEIKAYN